MRKNIHNLVQAFINVKNLINDGFELILVDNGSTDNTKFNIQAEIESNKFIKLVVVNRNIGYGYGILSGLKEATGDVLGWIHADLQFDPLILVDMFKSSQFEKDKFLYKGKRCNRPLLDTIFTLGMSIFESIYLKTVLWDINAQPTLLSKDFYNLLKNPPIDFSFDLFVYYSAKKRAIKIKKFRSPQRERKKRTVFVEYWL